MARQRQQRHAVAQRTSDAGPVMLAAVGLGALIVVAVVVIVLWLIPLDVSGNGEPDLPDTGGITLAEVIDNPDSFVTEQVSVVGRVDDWLSSAALTLEGPDTGDDELLVVIGGSVSVSPSNGESARWREGQPVEVSGTVRRFQLPYIAEIAGVPLNGEQFDSFLGQPVLVAQEIVTTTIDEVATRGGVLSAEVVDDRIDDLQGQTVAVRGEIETSIAPGILAFDDGDVLVVLQQPTEQIEDDAIVVVEGEVGLFDIERVSRHTSHQPAAGVQELVGRPAVYASSVDVFDALEEIAEEPARFLGEQVTVLVTVGEELGPNGFTSVGSGVVVITAKAGADIALRADVRVTGVVRIFDLADIEEIAGEDLDDEVFRPYLGEPTIVAAELEVYR